jgi:hypothetical protein
MNTQMMWRMARRVTAAVREMNEAQQRMASLRVSTDRYLTDPGTAPDTYAEFLMRTAGPLVHEPPACKR